MVLERTYGNYIIEFLRGFNVHQSEGRFTATVPGFQHAISGATEEEAVLELLRTIVHAHDMREAYLISRHNWKGNPKVFSDISTICRTTNVSYEPKNIGNNISSTEPPKEGTPAILAAEQPA